VRAGRSPRRWTGFRPLVVSAMRHETRDVVSVELAAPDGGELPSFNPGQFLTLALDAQSCENNVVRSYSLSGAAVARQGRYLISVKAMANGAVSPLIGRLKAGQTVLAQPPAGRFLLPRENEFPIVLLAAGIGITPFMSYLETLARQAKRPEVHLYYVSRRGVDHAFGARIRALAAAMPELRVVTCFSRPNAVDKPGEHYDHAGRPTLAIIDPTLLARRARFYMCGPDEMMASFSAALIAADVPQFEIFQERFTSPRSPIARAGAAEHTIVFRRSGLSLIWTPDTGSILDLAERHGVRIPTGCRVGQCESCSVPLIEGRVGYGIPLDDVDDGACLTCQAIPQSGVVIDA
jgi:ferredoxin-NADP reductase